MSNPSGASLMSIVAQMEAILDHQQEDNKLLDPITGVEYPPPRMVLDTISANFQDILTINIQWREIAEVLLNHTNLKWHDPLFQRFKRLRDFHKHLDGERASLRVWLFRNSTHRYDAWKASQADVQAYLVLVKKMMGCTGLLKGCYRRLKLTQVLEVDLDQGMTHIINNSQGPIESSTWTFVELGDEKWTGVRRDAFEMVLGESIRTMEDQNAWSKDYFSNRLPDA